MEINKENAYIKNAKRIKELCEDGKWDVSVATAKWEKEAGFAHDHNQHFEFLETISTLRGLNNLIARL